VNRGVSLRRTLLSLLLACLASLASACAGLRSAEPAIEHWKLLLPPAGYGDD
jgi:hypothetical protein